MGIQERRERERAAVRQQIVDAAEMIAADKGWDAVTIRAVAGTIEYSPALIYEYFANKDEILFALMRQGFGAPSCRACEGRRCVADPGSRR